VKDQTRRAAGGATAILLAVGLTFSISSSAGASTTLYPNPNPAGSPSVRVDQLPSCSGLNEGNAAGQGWIGDWRMPMQINARTAQATLLLPCRSVGNTPRVWISEYSITVTGTGGNEVPAAKILSMSITCNGSTQPLAGTPLSSAVGSVNTPANAWYTLMTPVGGTTFCKDPSDQLQRINIAWQSRFNGSLITGTAVWQASLWSSTAAVIPPATSIGNVPMPGGAFETPIVCTLPVDQTDILTTVGSFFEGFGAWFTCLWVPAGWDRSAQLDAAWKTNGISRVGDVFNAALPGAGSVVCGTVLDINTDLVVFDMSTCPLANAVPAWIKIVIASIATIAMLMLFIRRFQRTMGA